jgi:hypothetical protein
MTKKLNLTGFEERSDEYVNNLHAQTLSRINQIVSVPGFYPQVGENFELRDLYVVRSNLQKERAYRIPKEDLV